MLKVKKKALMFILETFKNNKSMTILLWIFILCESAIIAYLPRLVGNVFGLSESNMLSFEAIRKIIFFFFLQIFIIYFVFIITESFKYKFLKYWQNKLMQRVIKGHYEKIQNFQAGYLSKTITSNIHSSLSFFTKNLPKAVSSFILVLVSIIMLMVTLPRMTLILISVIIIIL